MATKSLTASHDAHRAAQYGQVSATTPSRQHGGTDCEPPNQPSPAAMETETSMSWDCRKTQRRHCKISLLKWHAGLELSSLQFRIRPQPIIPSSSGRMAMRYHTQISSSDIPGPTPRISREQRRFAVASRARAACELDALVRLLMHGQRMHSRAGRAQTRKTYECVVLAHSRLRNSETRCLAMM